MAIRFHESLPRNWSKLLPKTSEGKVFVVETSSFEILFFLCAFVVCWDNVKALVGGQRLTEGVFSVNDGLLTIIVRRTKDGWPSPGQKAYVLRDIQEDLESDKVRLEIIHV
ncbi:MAG: hypothetical protein HY007_00220 [Candidatus Sungbacteria bacterium]|nr:hypothetical protein [Candidatus Sungbacteria bacterium]